MDDETKERVHFTRDGLVCALKEVACDLKEIAEWREDEFELGEGNSHPLCDDLCGCRVCDEFGCVRFKIAVIEAAARELDPAQLYSEGKVCLRRLERLRDER